MKRSLLNSFTFSMPAILGILAITPNQGKAQGWVAPSSDVLTPYNSALGFSPMSIGIGVTAPTEQLHTNAGVRFTGLTLNNTPHRVVVQDSTGKLFSADPLIFGGSGNAWLLSGNAATVPGTATGQNFLGTTDAKRLVVATNNTERMTVLANGMVGVNTTTPTNRLEIIGDPSTDYDQLVGIGGSAPSIRMFGPGTAPTQAPWTFTTPYAKIGLATATGQFTSTCNRGDLAIQTIDTMASIVFSNYFRPGGSGREQMRLDRKGQLGINTIAPTARLHVNCAAGKSSDVRFENLPSGSGDILVVDPNGYVYRSHTYANRPAGQDEDNEKLMAAITKLQKEVDYLLAQNEALRKGKVAELSLSDISIFPNPAINSTTIELKNTAAISHAQIEFFDANGKMVLKASPDFGTNNRTEINTTSLAPGTYLVKVIGDQKLIGAKSIVIIK